jgi:hypothetical protein
MTDHVSSFSTGHQVSEGRGYRKTHLDMRARAQKFAHQTAEGSMDDKSKVLRQVRVYVNGFLSNTTDIEMKRVVSGAGGQIV